MSDPVSEKKNYEAGRILLAATGWDPSVWKEEIRRHAPDRQVVFEPDGPEDPSIRYAAVWKQPRGLLTRLPNLKVIFSLGAGVDHVFQDETIPDVPIVRIVSPNLTMRMSEYVVWQVLDHHRYGPRYRMQQEKHVWHEVRDVPAASDITVGIFGLGELGRDAALKLKMLGFNVTGWSRTKRQVEGVACHASDAGLEPFLASADIFVVLLPLTPDTRGILNRDMFAKMTRHGPLGAPVLINAGRGGLQVEADILAALDDGTLSAASLDVFATEPLPEESLLWSHPKVTITPHAAAVSSAPSLVGPMVRQMEAFERGEPLESLVDRKAGY